MERIPDPRRVPHERFPDARRLPTREQAEFMAELVLRDHGIVRAPVDVYELARHRGIVDVVEDDISKAAVMMGGPAGPVVILRRRDPPSRKRFSLAHEIGHRILHPAYASVHELAPIAARHDYDRLERTVNHFAACLLMPRGWIQEEVAIGRTTDEIAKRFDVSYDAMSRRMRELGLATQRGRLQR